MCCPLDQIKGRLVLAVAFDKNEKNQKILHLKGIYDHTPKTLGERISRFFQRLELLEKIAEIADESFHLFGSLLQRYTNLMVYQRLRSLHHAAHDVEHTLHAFCFLGDLSRLFTGQFIVYEGKKIAYLPTLSRLCHTIAHSCATAQFVHELKLVALDKIEKVFKYGAILSTIGYAVWTISLIWQRHQGKVNQHFSSDLSIHLGGFFFESFQLINRLDIAAPYSFVINKIASLAGIIHAWCFAQRLMPQDQEEVATHFVLPEEKEEEAGDEHVLHHYHDDHDEHCHSHELKFYPVSCCP